MSTTHTTNTLELREKADAIVRSHVLWSIGSGIIPVPLGDLVALTALQVGMIEQLAKLYDVDYGESSGKNFVRALTGTAFARIGASLIKFIPGIGTMAGAVAMSISGGASTYALGQVIISQFENHIPLHEVDLNAAKASYDANYKRGEQVAKDMRRKQHDSAEDVQTEQATHPAQAQGFSDTSFDASPKASDTSTVNNASAASASELSDDEIFSRIEKLAALHEKGILSQAEFESKKSELLARL